MILPRFFFRFFVRNGVSFFTGVPDSVLKEFCNYLCAHVPPQKHIIAANEGGAVALAAGYYLASGRIPLVYMQNAGLGNAVNPLTSFVNKEVYGVPMILLIGWRGEQNTNDESQHKKEGESLLPMLEVLGIPYAVFPDTEKEAGRAIAKAVRIAKKQNAPYALVVRRGTFGV